MKSLGSYIALMFLVSITTSVSGAGSSEKQRVWNFDRENVGKVPADWSIRQTNPSKAMATWQVIKEPTAPSHSNVMALTETKNYDGTFNLAIATNTSYKDLDLSVKVKPISGEEDQGGGPIWRCRDENNYYITRFNPLESNFRVYSVKNGRRRQLQSARVDTQPGTWYTVRVRMVGDHITCYLNGRKLLEATDDTFKDAGMIGLWTKSDAVTRFDDLGVRVTHTQETSALMLRQTIALPGVKGRFDHLTLDETGNRLFLAALGNDTVEVIDLTAGRRIHRITGLSEPQGILYLPKAKKVVVACGGDGTVRSFDAGTFQETARRDLGDDADNLRWGASNESLYVAFGDGALGALDPGTLTVRYETKLAGHPESFQLDRLSGHIYVNVPDARQIAVIDPGKRSVLTTWKLAGASENYPMALDQTGKRLFVGCRKPARLLVFDTVSGSNLATVECVGDADDIFYDAEKNRVYVIGGEGFVDIFSASPALSYPRMAHIRTSPGARTGLFVSSRKLLYVALPALEEQDAQVQVFQVFP